MFVDFCKAFDSILRGKLEQILLAYGLSKETVTALMMMILYENMKAMVYSPDREWFLWYCHWSHARRYINTISIHNLPRLRTMNINRFNERKWFLFHMHTHGTSRWHPTKTITNTDYEDDLTLFINTSAQAESLLYRLEQAARGIGVNMNWDKTELTHFNQDVAISLNNKPVKLVDQFT